MGPTRLVWTRDAGTCPCLVLTNVAASAMATGCVTVIRTVTVMRAGLLLTADTLEVEEVWTADLHKSPEIQILRGWLSWSFSCLCCRCLCCLWLSAFLAVDEALCTSGTHHSIRPDRAGLLQWSLRMLEMEIRHSRSGTSGLTRATSPSPRLSARTLFPPNLQFPRNRCPWILHVTLLPLH